MFYSFFGDITNNCNLRCPFCYNTWKVKNKGHNITTDQFKEITKIFPLIAHSIHLSCAFEPTLNPYFHEILRLIPDEQKSKVLFTTNLSTKISDELITAMSESGINFINISLDSLNSQTYSQLRKNAKFEIFMENLERLVEAIIRSKNKPKLRYITTVNDFNINELSEIIKACSTKYLSTINEIRRMRFKSSNNIGWINKHDISDAKWNETVRQLRKLNYCLDFKPDTYSSIKRALDKNVLSYFINDFRKCFFQYSRMFFESGTTNFIDPKLITFTTDDGGLISAGRNYGAGDKYRFDDINDLYSFFSNLHHDL